MPLNPRVAVPKALIACATALTLLGGLLSPPAHAVPPAVECPTALPVADVRAGMTGEGLTVVRGSTPETFAVEVLGVLTNGIGAGRDMIIIEASDVAGGHVIDQGGGIWAGMSGSPVYVDGKLLGAVAYGFSASPSPIGGVTPAADMLDLLNLGDAAARRAGKLADRDRITLTTAERRAIAARADAAVPTASLQRLPVPLTLSGLSSRRIDRLQSEADAAGWRVKAHAGGRAAAPAADVALERPQAGGNFAAALAYGDVTAAAIGTTTAVCESQALAFGHPFNYLGPVANGANDGEALAIIRDETFGAFKLANVTAPFGTVDQDRLAGLRADLSTAPTATPLRTTVTNDDTDRSRVGTTDVVDAGFLPTAGLLGVWANYDAVFDEWSDGQATSRWIITGTRAGGRTFRIVRANRWADLVDVTVPPAEDAALTLDALVNNEYEPVTITGVDYDSTVSTTYDQWRIVSMAVSVNLGPFRTPNQLSVKAGSVLRVRVSMRPYRSLETTTSVVTIQVPSNAAGKVGVLSVTGGLDAASSEPEPDEGCLLSPETCEEQTEPTFDSLLRGLTSVPRNDQIVADLRLESEEGEQQRASAKGRPNPATVTGQRVLPIAVR